MSKHRSHARVSEIADLPDEVRQVVTAAHAKKGFDVVVLEFRDAVAFTDYFVLCSARNARQVRAIVDEVDKQLRTSSGRPSHIEGYDHGEWVLMDFFTFVVHVFTPETRQFYGLERLWGNATRIEVAEPG